jgi:hypothetical protein
MNINPRLLPLVIVLVVLIVLALVAAGTALWNYVMPTLGMPELAFREFLALYILSRILLGTSPSASVKGK